MRKILFYDYEVTKYDWLTVIIDMDNRIVHNVVNDPEFLRKIHEEHVNDIWVGFNNKHYDQYIHKGILLGMNPKTINDRIIVDGMEGWQLTREFQKIPMINYDVMPNPPIGLKTLEGFMGSNIKETDVPFDIDRKLTPEEIRQMQFYCRHDVERTADVFMKSIDNFNAMLAIVKAFPDLLDLSDVGSSEARITSKVLGCRKQSWTDEFDFYFFDCLRIRKYQRVVDWFRSQIGNPHGLDPFKFYKQSFTMDVAGVPHNFGFGGLHGAADHPIHRKGQLLHVDVNNYYPSILIAHNCVTRSATNDNYALVYNTRKALKMKQVVAKKAGNSKLAKSYKKQQLPYKKMLNALSGAMKDKGNPAYDPRNNNVMCINGQLMLLDLIEHLEVIDGFELIQSNTDGLIIMVPDTDEAFNRVDDICYEWEMRCSTDRCQILLETDQLLEIYQKDVNNYLWIEYDGSCGERKGAYVKELSALDNDLPILNKALVDYMVKKVPVEQTIMECNDLIMFQKIVKLSSKYKWVEHEHCTPRIITSGVRVKKQFQAYDHTDRYTYKAFRVFASTDPSDGRILKCGGQRGKPEKFGNTPEHCFIWNDDVKGVECPLKLDKGWYIDKAKERLMDFGIQV